MKTFQKWLQEVTKDDIEKASPEGDPVFDNIFGDKDRIVIPLDKEKEYAFKSAMRSAGYEVDFPSNTATQTIQTQQGPKIVKERIGKAISKLIKKDKENAAIWEFWLKWWEVEKPKLDQSQKTGTGVSIVISRHPTDVLRMSDHEEMSSCHSPGGTWYACAISEARNGGAISYIVRNKDLEKIDIDDQDEIFSDPDRDIKGIEPLERLRLRRLSKKNKDVKGPDDILVPEISTYGIRHAGFVDTIKSWALDAQKLDSKNPPDYKGYDLRGGSYKDNDIDALWNKLFGLKGENAVRGDKKSVDKSDNFEDFFDSAKEMLEEHNRKWKHYDGNIDDIDYEEMPMVSLYASTSFEFPENIFKQIPDEKDFGYKGTLRHFAQEATGDWYFSDDVYVDARNGKVSFGFTFDDDENGTTYNDLVEFERTLDLIDRLDKDYEEHKTNIYNYLMTKGYLKDWRQDEKINNFKNFFIQGEENEYPFDIISNSIWLGNLQGLSREKVRMGIRPRSQQPVDMGTAVPIDFPQISEIKANFPQAFLPNVRDVNISWFAHSDLRTHLSNNMDSLVYEKPIWVGVHLIFTFENPEDNETLLPIIQSIDKNFNQFQSRAQQYWKTVVRYLEPDKQPLPSPHDASRYYPIPKMPQFEPPKQNYQQLEIPFECKVFKQKIFLEFKKHCRNLNFDL